MNLNFRKAIDFVKSFFETKKDPGDLSKHRLYSDRYEDMRM
jgi:hypothetical protein